MAEVRRTAVPSSAVKSVGYDEKTRELEIEYRNGTYRYYPVPKQLFEEMMRSDSIGEFVEQRIKGRFIYRRVEED